MKNVKQFILCGVFFSLLLTVGCTPAKEKKLPEPTGQSFFPPALMNKSADSQTKTKTDGKADVTAPAPSPIADVPHPLAPDVPPIAPGLTSVAMAKNMHIGWNLGNTLDATYGVGLNTETGWGMPRTTRDMITAVAKAGFKTIRIPISWHGHVSGANHTIDGAWMNRVKEIVDWAIAENLYVIINIHHDNLTGNEIKRGKAGFALSADVAVQTASIKYIESIWTQIAAVFNNDYDEKLIFDLLNEPRYVGESNEWWIPSELEQKRANAIITAYEQYAINAIRASGGNNASRFIMVPAYAGSASMVKTYTMPVDSAKDRLLLSTHAYTPYTFALSNLTHNVFSQADRAELDAIFNDLDTYYVSKGIGVVMDEAGATDKNNLAEREAWFEYYFKHAYQKGIPTVLWDNMATASGGGDIKNGECHGYLNRRTCKWFFPTLIETAMKAVGVTDYDIPKE